MSLKYIKNPDLFQGRKKKKDYFEGWYFKFVNEKAYHSVAFIPGVSINQNDPHAFIQVFVSEKDSLTTHYVRFPLSSFKYDQDEFKIDIDQNHFEKDLVIINLRTDEVTIQGKFELSNHTPIKTSIYEPNIMGPFAYLSFMECYHGILSMHSTFSGKLLINQKEIQYHQEIAYIEKDWGKSFPYRYIWLEANHFIDKKTAFMFSYAIIPFKLFRFKGLIVNLVHQEKEYRFATYNKSRIKILHYSEHKAIFIIKKGKYQLEIEAKKERDISLKSPINGRMINQIKEGLSGEVKLLLTYKNEIIFKGTSKHAGIEFMW